MAERAVCAGRLTLLGNVVTNLKSGRRTLPQATGRAAALASVALVLFAVGAVGAWRYWMQVIAEQQRSTDDIFIASGLPTVTYAGAFGTAVCLLLIVTSLVAKWRDRTTASTRA